MSNALSADSISADGSLSASPAEATAVSVERLVVHRGKHLAVNGLSFTANMGQITALLGPNGAGKTTTVETCEGFHRAGAGSIHVLGLDARKHRKELTARVGVMLQDGGVPTGSKADEALKYMASLYANPLDPDELAATLGLDTITSTYRRMSGGEQQKLKFAISIIGRPEVVFLDEPTAGMDLETRNVVWEIIHGLRGAGVGIILTTHQMEDVERLADKIVLINDGQLVAEGSPAEFTQQDQASIRFNAAVGIDFSSLTEELDDNLAVEEFTPGSYRIMSAADVETLAKLTNWCVANSIPLTNVSTEQERLEDVITRLDLQKVDSKGGEL